jgi:DUF1016 N-terminal domain
MSAEQESMPRPLKGSPASDYAALVASITETHNRAQRQAAQAVNVALTLRNWLIGYSIVEYEQHGSDRARYGARLLETLARDLPRRLGRGFARRNLETFRRFYQNYQIPQSLIAESGPVLPRPINEQRMLLEW